MLLNDGVVIRGALIDVRFPVLFLREKKMENILTWT
jgi:hypothetical protein